MSIMEILLSFVAGLVIAALVAVFVVKKIVRTRTEQAEMSVKLQVESMYKAENASLQSDLKHSEERVKELQGAVEAAKAEGAQLVVAAKAEAAKAQELAKAEWAQRHKEDMDALQARFDETMAKVTAQVKAETNEMLKARQKEFSETSNLSLGQIVNPLKENIAELKKAMEEGNKEQAERNGEMRERIKSLMEHSDAARKSADELAAAFKHGSKIQGDWGETVP